jgi:2-methylcitrate dehydratase PrpD
MAEGVDPGDIERVEVGTYRAGVEICENTDPKTPYEAKFSLPYTVALAALNRPVNLAAFDLEGLRDPVVRKMMAKVSVALDPAAEATFPGLRAAEVAIATHDGSVRRFRQPTRRGDPDYPVSDDDLGEKFRMLAEPVIGAAAGPTLAALWRAEALERVSMIPAPERAAA